MNTPTFDTNALADLFRKAAYEVKHGLDYYDSDVCVCMCDALYHNRTDEAIFEKAKAMLNEYFRDDAIKAGADSYRWGKNFGKTDEEIRGCRELALYFLAAIAEHQ